MRYLGLLVVVGFIACSSENTKKSTLVETERPNLQAQEAPEQAKPEASKSDGSKGISFENVGNGSDTKQGFGQKIGTTVFLGKVQTDGLDPTSVKLAFRKNREMLKRCFELEVLESKLTSGTLVVDATVNEIGVIENVSTRSMKSKAAMGESAVGCVEKAIQSFPAFAATSGSFSVPITFTHTAPRE